MLRAIRRPNPSGRPSGVERQHRDGVGATDAGGEAATVVRSMFTHGSRAHHRPAGHDVLACVVECAPHARATRAHSRRAARSFAIVGNCSSVAA